MNIVIDGCEKAGKTTLIAALVKRLNETFDIVDILKWNGRAAPDDSEYTPELQMFAPSLNAVAVWDRAWPSEYVYGKLLKQDRRLAADPWLGAWLHDRAVLANGLRIIMLGPGTERLAKLRNSSDLPVDPEDEVKLYKEYAQRFDWLILEGYQHTAADLKKNVDLIYQHVLKLRPTFLQPLPPLWSGPQDAKIVFVGSSNFEKGVPGSWLPFSGRSGTEFGRAFGDEMVRYAWTSTRSCNPAYLRNRRIIVACGNIAHLWIKNYVANKENKDQQIIYVPDPSYLFKFSKTDKKLSSQFKKTIMTVQQAIS